MFLNYREAGKVIKGHKPLKVFEHSPDTVCCLSLKTWAVWLLEITHNAHNWTQWASRNFFHPLNLILSNLL